MGTETYDVYTYGNNHPEAEVEMPNGVNAAGGYKAQQQKGCTEREKPSGAESIYQESRDQGKRGMDEHCEGIGPCGLAPTPTIFSQNSHIENSKRETRPQSKKKGDEGDPHNDPTVIKPM
jgi:hypothetical protein